MKKLLVLTAIAMLTASTVGCGCGRWFNRGAWSPCYDSAPCYSEPACGPCDTCATPTYGAMTPGPGAYTPAPIN